MNITIKKSCHYNRSMDTKNGLQRRKNHYYRVAVRKCPKHATLKVSSWYQDTNGANITFCISLGQINIIYPFQCIYFAYSCLLYLYQVSKFNQGFLWVIFHVYPFGNEVSLQDSPRGPSKKNTHFNDKNKQTNQKYC